MISTSPPPSVRLPAGPKSEAVFTARSAELALALVKRALGPDALVVSSRALGEGADACFQVHATSAAGGFASGAGLLEPAPPRSPPTLGVLERILREHDVPAALARALVLRTEARLAAGSTSGRLVSLLRTGIGFGDSALATARVVALVGPTGVGKTTTIAKLAARDALIHGRRVGLVSLDNHRVGGAEQLSRYAELIGIPFEVASDVAGLRAALARMSSADRVYIDTAGRAPRERSAHVELLGRLAGGGAGVAVALCVPAASRSTELAAVLEAHVDAAAGFGSPRGSLRPRALIVTKLDEAVLVGAAIAAAVATELPIAWLTTGQRVPEDLELATAERLARALAPEDC